LAWFHQIALSLAAVAGVASCGGSSGPSVTAIFELRRSQPLADFYRLPWPTDLRLTSTGSPDLTEFPTDGIALLQQLASITQGFSPNGAIYFRFDGAVGCLPADPASSLATDSSVYLVDIDPASAQKGERIPIKTKVDMVGSDYITAPNLDFLPFPGFPMRPGTKYAAVITDRVCGASGGPVKASPDFLAVMADDATSDPAVSAARTVFAPLKSWLDANNIPRTTIVSATVFTTQDPISLMQKARQVVLAQVPAPTAANLSVNIQANNYTEYVGTYGPAPIFQKGTSPYHFSGGTIAVDNSGNPIIDHNEPALRLSISVPKGTMPNNGWPVVVYAHGTGGGYESYIVDGPTGSINDGSASHLAQVVDPTSLQVVGRFAMISTDQVVHGPIRNPMGLCPDPLFFNTDNLPAARDNVRQGAIDNYTLVRLAQSFDMTMPDGNHVKLDPTNVYFYGHSQGGITGPPFLGFEPNVKAAVLSGAGGNLIEALLHKTAPVDITQFIFALVRDNNLDEFNPVLTVFQDFIDSGDPVNYGRILYREPVAGVAPKPIFQSEGFVDHFAPIETIEAFGTSIGVQPILPEIQPVAGTTLRGLAPIATPVSDNVMSTTGQKVTAVLAQYQCKAPECNDGHFVLFTEPQGIAQYTNFLATLVATGTATVPSVP
jgi:hypothetical protein